MKKMKIALFGAAFSLPALASAADDALKIPEVQKFFAIIVNPVVNVIFAAAAVYFIYGVFSYFIKGENSSDRIQGANHILWSTIGLFIMVSVWGIIAFLQNVVLK